MKKYSVFASVAAGALLLASCGTPQLQSTTVLTSSTSASKKTDSSLAGQLHHAVNLYRQSAGRGPVERHPGLDRLAQQHSEFMCRNRGKFSGGDSLSHHGFEDRTLVARRTMQMGDVSENLALCYGNTGEPAATRLLRSWQGSSSHDRNIKGIWNATGVGVAVDKDGTVFATQIFGLKEHSHMATVERMRQF